MEDNTLFVEPRRSGRRNFGFCQVFGQLFLRENPDWSGDEALSQYIGEVMEEISYRESNLDDRERLLVYLVNEKGFVPIKPASFDEELLAQE
jgi:hypothetical protein